MNTQPTNTRAPSGAAGTAELRPARARVVVDSMIRLAASDLGEAALCALMARLSVANPAHLAAARRGRPTRHIPRTLCAVRYDGDTVTLPRGAMPELRAVAHEHGLKLTVEDRRVWPETRVTYPSRPNERPHQSAAKAAYLPVEQASIIAACGAGKTATACAIGAELRTPVLVLVPTTDLVVQWADEVRRFLGVEPGCIAAGKDTRGPVTIATVAALVAMSAKHKERLRELLASVGLLVVDESHHAAAPTWRAIIDACPSRYRLGVTATPREDGLGQIVTWTCGRIVARIEQRELIEAGHLVRPERVELLTEFRYDYIGSDDWAPLLDALWRDEARNTLIVREVERRVGQGHTVIVLLGRVEHCERIADALRVLGIAGQALTGRTRPAERARILDEARSGAVRVLVATSLADEGLSVNQLSCVVLGAPARAAGRLEQRTGRALRPAPGKSSALVVDVVDPHVGVLARQANHRRKVFARLSGGQS